VRINAQKKPDRGRVGDVGRHAVAGEQHAGPPGDDPEVYLGSQGAMDVEGRESPRLWPVYSTCPGYNHHTGRPAP
jgi:hypothetical protein